MNTPVAFKIIEREFKMTDTVTPISQAEGWKKPGRGGARKGAGRKPGRPQLPVEEVIRREAAKAEAAKVRDEYAALWNKSTKPGVGACVYVVHENGHPDICKIGMTTAGPYARLSSLQVGNWRPLILAGFVEVATSDMALLVESIAHRKFGALHCSGEWFSVSAERAVAELKTISLEICVAFEDTGT